MDFRRYKTAAPLVTHWPGRGMLVGIKPLSVTQVTELSLYEATQPPELANLSVRVQTLAAALCEPAPPHKVITCADELAAALHAPELHALTQLWLKVQTDSCPNADALEHALRRRMLEGDNDALLDGMLAVQTESPERFYGQACPDCTLGQLLYFWTAQRVYHELFLASPHAERAISRKMLPS